MASSSATIWSRSSSARAAAQIEKPIRNDPELELVRKRGYEHERLYIEQLEAQGRTVVEMQQRDPKTPAELRAAEAETLAAHARRASTSSSRAPSSTAAGAATRTSWSGATIAPSGLGAWSYDVADTKLAKRVKAAAIVQMCVYADQLERLQGIPPETISVVTGDRESHEHRLADYAAYYRSAKRRFEERVFPTDPVADPDTYPEPVDHCRVCSWWAVCVDRRRADDHLSIVAGAARTQRRKLVDAGVTTLAGLATLPPDRGVREMNPRILERLRRQASLQLEKRLDGVDRYELIPPNPDEPGKGLGALPPPSRLDVFFDIEADPWALDDGLEYLFGWTEVVPGAEPAFHAIWAHDRAEEKAMLEAFVDLVMERRRLDPGMHVYHYGGYESGALKRLMQRHATREDEIDVLLRGHVLVNLYDHVVRPGIRASVESYSIKKLETFYMPQREGGITHAGFSVVEYERWMEQQDPSDPRRHRRLQPRRLHLQPAAPRLAGGAPRRGARDASRVVSDRRGPEARLGGRRGIREGPGGGHRGPPPRGRAPCRRSPRTGRSGRRSSRAAGSSRRSSTGTGARRSRSGGTTTGSSRHRSTTSSRTTPRSPGSGSSRIAGASAKSSVHRYAFDPAQDTKVVEGKAYLALSPNPLGNGWDMTTATVVEIDSLAGTIDLKRTAANPHPVALIPGKPFGAGHDARCPPAAGRPRDRARDRRAGCVPGGPRPGPRAAAADRRP